MMLRNSISNTKKFFQKTVDNVKSFLSKGTTTPATYQRLPKTPPFHHRTTTTTTTTHDGGDAELDNFYTEFTHQWDNNNSRNNKTSYNLRNRAQKIKSSIIHPRKSHHHHNHNHHHHNHHHHDHSSMQETNSKDESKKTPEKKLKMKSEIMKYYSADLCSKSVRERRLNCVKEKMMELEKMDIKGNNDDQKKDVEEFLECYSRLTCPAYLDIVDKFFKEMSSEFFTPPNHDHHHHQHHHDQHHHHHHHHHQQQHHHHHEASSKVNNSYYSRTLWKAVKV